MDIFDKPLKFCKPADLSEKQRTSDIQKYSSTLLLEKVLLVINIIRHLTVYCTSSASRTLSSTLMQTIYITTRYGWDQNDNTISLYIPIPKANELKKEKYTLSVQARSIQFGIDDHEGVNYSFKISNLCGELLPSVSEIKLKPNRVVLRLQKKEVGKYWNDIKVKRISDVFSQVQRRIDASEDGRKQDMEDYGLPSFQDAIKGALTNASPTVKLAAEKMLSEQQQSSPQTTLNPFDISDLATPTSSSSPHSN
ncbi:unnamed protein product [Absidia cylindrospora]